MSDTDDDGLTIGERRLMDERDRYRAVLELVPIDEWQEWTNRAVLDMIEEDVMHAFLAAAREALEREA